MGKRGGGVIRMGVWPYLLPKFLLSFAWIGGGGGLGLGYSR